tara:strand:- start:73 stop:504 length:432 start_codon:yes stop_codon:yes gene_type:complete
MSNFFPIVVDSTNSIIKELPSGDTLDLTNSIIKTKDFEVTGAVYQNMNTSSTTTFDLSVASFFKVTLSANLVISAINNATASMAQSFAIEVVNSGAYSITWPGTVRWDGGTAPTLTENRTILFMFYTTDGGTIFRGQVVMETS